MLRNSSENKKSRYEAGDAVEITFAWTRQVVKFSATIETIMFEQEKVYYIVTIQEFINGTVRDDLKEGYKKQLTNISGFPSDIQEEIRSLLGQQRKVFDDGIDGPWNYIENPMEK